MHLQTDLENTVLAHYTTHLKLLERGKEKEKFRVFFQIFLRRHAKMKRHKNHSARKNNSMKFRKMILKKASCLEFIFLFVLFVALLAKEAQRKREARFVDEFIIWT